MKKIIDNRKEYMNSKKKQAWVHRCLARKKKLRMEEEVDELRYIESGRT